MDYFPRVFSQKDLFWLDNLMPDSGKSKKKANNGSGAAGADGGGQQKSHTEEDGVKDQVSILFS